MPEKALPCPFCGATISWADIRRVALPEVKTIGGVVEAPEGPAFRVECPSIALGGPVQVVCARGPIGFDHASEEKATERAIALWNRRMAGMTTPTRFTEPDQGVGRTV